MSLTGRIAERMLVPPRGKFQVQGVRFFEQQNGRAILGDDMGLGKTWQAICYRALHSEAGRTIIICPTIMKYKWQNELKQFAGLKSTVLNGFKPYGVRVKVRRKRKQRIPGTTKTITRRVWVKTCWWAITKEDRRKVLAKHRRKFKVRVIEYIRKPLPKISGILIINYDILADWKDFIIGKFQPGMVVIDECQYIKNRMSARSKIIKAIAEVCRYRIGLSGTPITNRPSEFFPILNIVAPDDFSSFIKYGFRYCKPKKAFRRRGWDFSGASRLGELHERVSGIMLRRLKTDVLKELPPKVRIVIPVDIDNRGEYEQAKKAFRSWLLKTKGPDAARRALGAEAIVRLGVLKRLAAEGKVAAVVRWIKDYFEDGGKKLVGFAVHKRVISRLMDAFPKAVKIDGSVKGPERYAIENRFLKDPKCRLLFGNVKAAGIGINLTSADTVFGMELPWAPGDVVQYEDRLLRIGQTSDRMNSIFFIARNTVDERHIELLNDKDDVVGQILDGKKRTDRDVQQKLIEYILGD